MESVQKSISLSPRSTVRGKYAKKGLFFAVLIAPLLGIAWAWVANVAQFYFAPVLLFPILIGVFVGLSIVLIVHFAQIGHRPTILLAVVLAAIVAAAGQHAFAYLNTYYWTKPSIPASSAAVPNLSSLPSEARPSFGTYMQAQAQRGRPLPGGWTAHGNLAWLTWTIDALLLIAGAVVVTIPAMRVPYCNHCGTWYRIVRGGKIDVETSQRLAAILGVELLEHPRSPRYRLSACQCGNSPTRCELSWEEIRGSVDLVQAWLDAEARSRFVAIVDGLENPQKDF
jgi:hypothetical protein